MTQGEILIRLDEVYDSHNWGLIQKLIEDLEEELPVQLEEAHDSHNWGLIQKLIEELAEEAKQT